MADMFLNEVTNLLVVQTCMVQFNVFIEY